MHCVDFSYFAQNFWQHLLTTFAFSLLKLSMDKLKFNGDSVFSIKLECIGLVIGPIT